MKKILFVDYIQQIGHVNFNRIHIESLIREGYDVKVVVHKDIASRLPFPHDTYAFLLPLWMRQHKGHPVMNRIRFLLALLYVRCHLWSHHYDEVVLSCIDEPTLWLLPPSGHFWAVCHGNAMSLTGGGWKRRFLRGLRKKASFLVFDDYMARPFRDNNLSVSVISHGCVPPFPAVYQVSLPNVPHGSHLIFHPSSKMNERCLYMMQNDNAFQSFLEETDTFLLLNGKGEDKGRIRFVHRRLNDNEYRSLFMRSDIILMAYPNTFIYSVSGVSFECVSNRKKMLVYKIPSMEYCSRLCNYDPFFSNVSELASKARKMYQADEQACCMVSPDLLQPSYAAIFENRTH